MRAKEFIIEYVTVTKPDFTKVSKQCLDCNGTGNVDRKGTTQTCPSCKGVGSNYVDDNQSNYASDTDFQMNQPWQDSISAAGKH